LERRDGFSRGIPHNCSDLHTAPTLASGRKSLAPALLMVHAELTDEHVEHVFKARAEPAPPDGKVEVGHLGYRSALSDSTGKPLPTRRSDPRSRHDESKGVPVSVDLDVGSGDIACRGT
jgi:hypothetical protein